jgi:hypothetical protein
MLWENAATMNISDTSTENRHNNPRTTSMVSCWLHHTRNKREITIDFDSVKRQVLANARQLLTSVLLDSSPYEIAIAMWGPCLKNGHTFLSNSWNVIVSDTM